MASQTDPAPITSTSNKNLSSTFTSSHQGSGDDDETWKTDHPYKTPTPEESARAIWHGSCHCGTVQYTLSREEPLASKYCHCSDCQTMHGAPFQWAAIFHKSDLRFARGTHGLAFYTPSLRSPTRVLPCKVSCATCHAPVMDEGRRMVMLFPELLAGDAMRSPRGREAFRVRDHLCWPARVVGNDAFVGDGVRKWAGVDGRSELLDDGTGKGEERAACE